MARCGIRWWRVFFSTRLSVVECAGSQGVNERQVGDLLAGWTGNSPEALCWLRITLVSKSRFRPQPGFGMDETGTIEHSTIFGLVDARCQPTPPAVVIEQRQMLVVGERRLAPVARLMEAFNRLPMLSSGGGIVSRHRH